MCLTIPGKIKSITDSLAIVENGTREARIDLGLVLDAKVNDWVLYATDRAVRRISEKDAREIIALLEDHYHPIDVAALPLQFKKILFKVRSGQNNKSLLDSSFRWNDKEEMRDNDLTGEEIIYLLNLKGENNLETLFAEANSLRKEMIEDFVCIHGIIEFSNCCRNNCLYCGIRKDNKHLKRYRMSKEEIIETVVQAVQGEGYKLIVLQSGEDMSYSDQDLLNIIKEIKERMRVFIFLSVGERSEEFYKKAFLAGASGSLMRFETSNLGLFEKMRPGHKLEDRISSIKYQASLGYYIASGSLIGLPGQTINDIADDLLMIRELNIPMISAGPWLPASGTPLENFQSSDFKQKQTELFLKYIAVARLMMPKIKIPVTTALETLDPKNGRHRGLLAGANALMFSLTPEKYCADYNIYDNKYREQDKVWQKYGLFKGEESWEMIKDRLNEKY